MKNLYLIVIFIAVIGCSGNKVVYWCGDHPCVNKKEKEAYFKKTMTVEIREIKKNTKKISSEIEKITQQAKLNKKKVPKNEKNLLKQSRIDEEKRIKEEKALLKQLILEEKKRIKEQKVSAKQLKREEKLKIKKQKKLHKKNTQLENNVKSSKFNELVEKIIKKNSPRSYPDINNIPN